LIDIGVVPIILCLVHSLEGIACRIKRSEHVIRVRKFAFPNLHQNIFEHVRKLGYLGESKKTATPP
tara:strand:- start:1453 stop:1650 length:198 start_codon:yes stop_codon:yes gene_type:complete